MRAAFGSGRTERIRLLIVLRSFSAGGAERQLISLLRGIDKDVFDVSVLCFYRGPWHEHASSIPGVRVALLDKRHRYDVLGFGLRALAAARRFRPHIIYGYMFGADLVTLVLARLTGAKNVWGLRSSNLDYGRYDRLSQLLFKLSCRFASRVDLVIANSRAGLAHYTGNGARPRRALVIANGIDTVRFRPDEQARHQVRQAWGVPDSARIIGMVARLDPMKGQEVFLRAAAQLMRLRQDVHFVCVGAATSTNAAYEQRVRGLCLDLGLSGHVSWLGHEDATEKVYPGFDLFTSPSLFGEGFSNSIAEAMACGVPCIVSDVGDSAHIVADSRRIVPPGDSAALCATWQAALGADAPSWLALRQRIVDQFSIATCVDATERALLSVAGPAPTSVSIEPGIR